MSASHPFPHSSFKAYDIRGVVPTALNPEFARELGRGLAARAHAAGVTTMVVGRDGRLSSPELAGALQEGMRQGGIDTIDVGQVPTPLVYFAAYTLKTGSGVAVTGSHNPPEYNGFKMMMGGRTLHGDAILALRDEVAAGPKHATQLGKATSVDILTPYLARVLGDIKLARPMKIAIDCGNGVAGAVAPQLFRGLGCEVTELFCDVDGTFPNHHPDPTDEKNLADLRRLVAEKNLDFGVAFDGDGDRIGAIDGQGRVIWGDQLLMIYAEDLLAMQPGAAIIADVKASRALFDHVARLGGRPTMWKTGHSLIKSKMKEIGAPLAGEMSGHVFFAHQYYGFDDALYAAVRLIAASARLGRSVTELRGAMPALVNTPELRFQVDESRKFAVIDEVKDRLAASGADVNAIDGVRVSTADGWWLLRASNTQDVLVARAESDSEEGCARLLAEVDAQLAASGLERGPQAGH